MIPAWMRDRWVAGITSCALVATALLMLAGVEGGVAEAAAKPGNELIAAPASDATLPARPLTVKVRFGHGAKRFQARLNGRTIGRHFGPPVDGVRELVISATHGLRYGPNHLEVSARRASGSTRSDTTRFRIDDDRPLAAAGHNRVVEVGSRVRLDASRSRSHLGREATDREKLGTSVDHSWKIVDAPEAAPDDALERPQSAQPILDTEVPGAYRIQLTVEADDGTTGSDAVIIRSGLVAPHIDAVATALRERNPGTEGKVWGLSTENTLPSQWLLQTPNCWGADDCGPGPLPPSADAITSRMTQIVAGAEHSVELTGLWPPPDGAFREAIVKGLQQAVAAGRTPTVRIVLGTPPTQFSDSQFQTWFDGLVAEVGGKVPIQAAAMSTYRQSFPPVATSWNHSKILAVDGQSAIVGGMNYWAGDYLQTTDPVNDVSITADGPAAADATRFTDVLWGWICANSGRSLYVSLRKSNVGGCVTDAETTPATIGDGGGGVPILTLGRLGNGIDVPGQSGRQSPPIPKAPVQGSACNSFQRQVSDTNTNPEYEYRNPGETGLRALIASAKSSIFLSQQDLLGCVYSVEAYFDERVLAALGQKIVDGVPITIVTADPGAKAGTGDYSNGYKLQDLAASLRSVVAALKPGADARQMVCNGVGLSGVRTLDAATWPNGHPYANHAKVVWVDNAAFYVGSENLYPARLQELGMVVEDGAAAATMKSDYLDPLWNRSRKGALIDPANGVCGSF